MDITEKHRGIFVGIFLAVQIAIIVIAILYSSNHNAKSVNNEIESLVESNFEDGTEKFNNDYDLLYCTLIDKLIEENGEYIKGDYIDKIGIDIQSFKGINKEQFYNILDHLYEYSNSIYHIDLDKYNSKGVSNLNVSLYIYFSDLNQIDERRVSLRGSIYTYQTKLRRVSFSCSKNIETGLWEVVSY